MQRLDSSLDPTLVACELPWFLGIPRDFSEKSWLYGTFLSPGVPLQGLPIWGATGATGLAPQTACLLGWLGAWLAPGLAWLAWVAGFGFDLV